MNNCCLYFTLYITVISCDIADGWFDARSMTSCGQSRICNMIANSGKVLEKSKHRDDKDAPNTADLHRRLGLTNGAETVRGEREEWPESQVVTDNAAIDLHAVRANRSARLLHRQASWRGNSIRNKFLPREHQSTNESSSSNNDITEDSPSQQLYTNDDARITIGDKIWVVNDDVELQARLKSTKIQGLFFVRDSITASKKLLHYYSKLVEQLRKSRVDLGLVDCNRSHLEKYCSNERSEKYLYIFHYAKEKLAIPLTRYATISQVVSHINDFRTYLPSSESLGSRNNYDERRRTGEKTGDIEGRKHPPLSNKVSRVTNARQFTEIICERNRATVVVLFYVPGQQNYKEKFKMLREVTDIRTGEQFETYIIKCKPANSICEHFNVASTTVIFFEGNGHNITYNGILETLPVLKALKMLHCNHILAQTKTTEDIQELFSAAEKCHPNTTVVAGIYPNRNKAKQFVKLQSQLRTRILIVSVLNTNISALRCKKDQTGCIIVFKPTDLFQPIVAFNELSSNNIPLQKEIEHYRRSVFDYLEYDRFFDDQSGDMNKIHFILILASLNEDDVEQKLKISQKSPIAYREKRIFNILGTLAAEFSSPDVIFSYLFGRDNHFAQHLAVDKVHLDDTMLIVFIDRKLAMFENQGGMKPVPLLDWIRGIIASNNM